MSPRSPCGPRISSAPRRQEAARCAASGARALILYLGKIRHRARGGTDFIQELQAIFAHFWIVVVDLHLVEERIDRRTQFCDDAHRAGKIFFCHGSAGFRLYLVDRFRKGLLLSETVERSNRRAIISL